MSEQKRALVVDDSRSARLVLRRMLEKYGVLVDTVESAADALEFLTNKRPDVVFMDHMMPGMNGFEAVRAIKDNPRTATIPVMMYTSKGGDLYLGQARALGAVGVLPKTVAPAELYESLLRIGLINERRHIGRTIEESENDNHPEHLEDPHQPHDFDIPVAAATFNEVKSDNTDEPLEVQLRRALNEQRIEIRKDLLMGLDTVARKSRETINRLLDEKTDALRKQVPPSASVLPTVLLVILLFISVIWNFTSQNSRSANTKRNTTNTIPAVQAQDFSGKKPIEDATNSEKTHVEAEHVKQIWGSVNWALNQNTNYPWDEIALDEARIYTVEQLLDQLSNAEFTGKLILETHVGEFCLQGDEGKGFALAEGNVTLDQCRHIMNPVQHTDSPSIHQSLAFANLIASSPSLQGNAITLEIQAAQRSEPLVSYPPRKKTTKAGEWNRAAAANNRVIIRLIPD